MSAEHTQVVVGFDFTPSGQAALSSAIGVANRAPRHILHFVCVIDPHFAVPIFPTKHVDIEYADRIADQVKRFVELELQRREIDNPVQFFVHARIGKPAQEILGVAKDVGADLIIVGSKGLTGLERAVIGSVSEKVVREAKCTVAVARAKGYAYVPLQEVVEVERHSHYAAPHRYTYESNQATRRPNDWPIY